MTQHDGYAAHFNADTSGVIIEHLDISDRDVTGKHSGGQPENGARSSMTPICWQPPT